MDAKGTFTVGVGLTLVLTGSVAACLGTGRRLPPTAREQMWSHFVQSAHLHLSVALGELDDARAAAHDIETAESIEGIPPEALSELGMLRLRAREVRMAQDLESVALASARLAATCGECHREHGQGPTFTDVAPAPDPDDVDHMVEHLWAADRMWEALTIPSDDHWQAGARVLADHAVPMDLLPRGTPGLGVQLKSLGLEALGDRTPEARVRRYADILETCATCHTRAGRAG
jgi:cytochrome c553